MKALPDEPKEGRRRDVLEARDMMPNGRLASRRRRSDEVEADQDQSGRV